MKLKKVLAIVLAATMIMGMSVTTFAANETSITVVTKEGTETEAELSKLQVIGADPTTETGWTFVNDAESAYTEAFGVGTGQDAIWSLIKYELERQAEEADTPVDYSKFSDSAEQKIKSAKEITAAMLDSALSKLYGKLHTNFTETSNPIIVNAPGVYAIHASADGFTYKMMAAYVGFTVADNVEYPTLPAEIDDITEKGAPTDVTKSGTDSSDGDTDTSNVVSIGDIVTYEITTTIPFIDPEAFNTTVEEDKPFFNITDAIQGAEYVLETTEGTQNYSIVYTDVEPNETIDATIALNNDKTGFTIDLTNELNAANTNAGRPIKITYQAMITDVTTDNTAMGHIPGKDFDGDNNTDKFVTGSVQLTKVDAEDTSEVKVGLPGAEFQVYSFETASWDPDAESNTLLRLVYDDSKGAYRPALTSDTNATTTITDVNNNGIFKIVGLDTGKYHFVETKAPEGYSINEDGRTIEIEVPGEDATGVLETESDILADTKLASLPSTGGIGTTIFTIGGCVIMIAAAGLYFASRRKQENK